MSMKQRFQRELRLKLCLRGIKYDLELIAPITERIRKDASNMKRDSLSIIEGCQLVSKEIMNAVDTLSKYYDIDLKYKGETENEIFYYVNVCLSELYKVNPHIKFVEIES